MFCEFDSYNSLLITSVVSSLYNDILSNSWTLDRYNNFHSFTGMVIATTQNKDIYTITYSLKLVERYINQFQKDIQLQKSEKSIFLTAFSITQKYLDDFYYIPWEIDLSLLTELNSIELKQFEWQFLNKINYNVTMTPDEYLQWETECQNVFITFVDSSMNLSINLSPNKYVDVLPNDLGLPSPPSSVVSSNHWALSSTDDAFFNDFILFE